MFDVSQADSPRTRRILSTMFVLATIDFVMLIVLLAGKFGIIDSDSFVAPLGMTHGLLFLLLVAIAFVGARQGRWNMKYPIAVVIAGLAALVIVPDILIRRELDAAAPSRDA
jgi:integral membrane protein